MLCACLCIIMMHIYIPTCLCVCICMDVYPCLECLHMCQYGFYVKYKIKIIQFTLLLLFLILWCILQVYDGITEVLYEASEDKTIVVVFNAGNLIWNCLEEKF